MPDREILTMVYLMFGFFAILVLFIWTLREAKMHFGLLGGGAVFGLVSLSAYALRRWMYGA